MDLTTTQKLLIYGLTLFPLSEEDQETIFLLMTTQEEQEKMIAFLILHEQATGQEIINEAARIIKSTSKK